MLKMVYTDSQIEPAPQEINGEVLTPGTNTAADAPPRLNIHARGFWELQGQWRIHNFCHMLIKNKSKKHSELFKNKFVLKNSPFLNVTPFVFLFTFSILISSILTSFFSILYSFPLIDFVILDMCFYLVINKELT